MQRAHRNWHLRIWIVLAVLMPAILATAAVLRTHQQRADAPVRIAPPVGGGVK